jgi:DNA-binding CsgD family transcriptional regulator
MTREPLVERTRLDIIRLCHSALESRTLRVKLLQHLRSVLPFDYAYFSTTDPATQLGTSSVLVEQPPDWCMSVFLQNEFLQDDFNKFSDMVRTHQSVGILSEATKHELHLSPRYQEMLLPMAMDDELRAIFVSGNACWGTLCLHRGKAKSGYTSAEAAYLAQLIPHIADGLRKALLLSSVSLTTTPDGPGVLVLADDLSIVATTAAAEYWLMELADMEKPDRSPLPVTVQSVVTRLKMIEGAHLAANSMPKVRLRTRSGHWLVLHASRLRGPGDQSQISVIFEVAQPAEIAPLIMQAYDLTKREGEVTQCVLRGWSTQEIAAQLYISQNTVQDHLKAIFEKVDVNSRGELAARLFTHYHQS